MLTVNVFIIDTSWGMSFRVGRNRFESSFYITSTIGLEGQFHEDKNFCPFC